MQYLVLTCAAACYLKSSTGAIVYNANIYGARLILAASTTAANSSSIASSTSTPLSSISPTATALSCPASNNTIYYAPSGDAYAIECDIDHPGGDMASSKAISLEQCIAACDADIKCVDVSLSGVACYEKSVLNPAVHAAGILGARLLRQYTSTPPAPSTTVDAAPAATMSSIAVGCPADNGTVYTTTSGQNFLIECSVDHPGGDLAVVRMLGGPSTWFGQCIEACANTTSCLDVSLSGYKYSLLTFPPARPAHMTQLHVTSKTASPELATTQASWEPSSYLRLVHPQRQHQHLSLPPAQAPSNTSPASPIPLPITP